MQLKADVKQVVVRYIDGSYSHIVEENVHLSATAATASVQRFPSSKYSKRRYELCIK